MIKLEVLRNFLSLTPFREDYERANMNAAIGCMNVLTTDYNNKNAK